MPTTKLSTLRTRWAAIGAAGAVTLGAGGIGLVNADKGSGQRAVTTAITACRLADTRSTTQIGAKAGAFEAGETFTFAARGNQGGCTIPDDVTGLDVNVTAVDATQPTYLTVWDTGPLPNASSLNPVPGQPPTPNAVTVDLAGDGTFKVFNLQGNVDVIIDVVAIHQHHHHDDRYFTKTQSDNRYPDKTETIVVSPRAFVSGALSIDWAPLALPAGSTITSITYHYVDGDSAHDAHFRLWTVELDTLVQSSFAEFTSEGTATPGSEVLDNLDITIEPDLSYQFSFEAEPSSSSASVFVVGVTVDYTLP